MRLSQRIRSLLSRPSNRDGLTNKVMSMEIGVCPDRIDRAASAMPDLYIRTWLVVPGVPGGPVKVWCRADIPEDAPRPRPIYRVAR